MPEKLFVIFLVFVFFNNNLPPPPPITLQKLIQRFAVAISILHRYSWLFLLGWRLKAPVHYNHGEREDYNKVCFTKSRPEIETQTYTIWLNGPVNGLFKWNYSVLTIKKRS